MTMDRIGKPERVYQYTEVVSDNPVGIITSL